ncbi:MAG TPA: OsmC family protein [Paenirhodobacter sp.]
MSDLNDYLVQKRALLLKRREKIAAGELGANRLKAVSTAEGRSGIRRIRIRDFQLISDSAPSLAGYDLGPGAPELLLGSLASCLVHSVEIQAASQQIALTGIEAECACDMDPRAGRPGYEGIPVHPHRFSYRITLRSDAPEAGIQALAAAVEKSCPILNLLKLAVPVDGEIVRLS